VRGPPGWDKLPRVRLLAGGTILLSVAACVPLSELGAIGPGLKPPSVVFAGATLMSTPSRQQLAATYCPDLVSVPLGGAPLLCQGLFGGRPSPETMAIAFDARFKIQNPNEVPLPMASLLAAVTVFPGAANEQTGATCVQLCPGGPGTCTGRDPATACQASSREVRSLSDFANAATDLVVSNGLAMGAGQPPSFTAPTVAAASEIEVVARFSLAPAQMLRVMRQLAEQSAGELRAGRAPSFVIPYRLQGTIWFDGGSFGRVAIPWGPVAGSWTL
jgi:hypothetical protein